MTTDVRLASVACSSAPIDFSVIESRADLSGQWLSGQWVERLDGRGAPTSDGRRARREAGGEARREAAREQAR